MVGGADWWWRRVQAFSRELHMSGFAVREKEVGASGVHVEKDMSNHRTWWSQIESSSTDRKDCP